MSRWIEQFNAHPFQEVWNQLKINLNESKIDDETVLTSVQELARLKKVVSYLDGIISGFDPELVPLATWNNFNTQATACSNQITNYNNNKNITHINTANDHADNLLTYVRPYMILEGEISEVLQDAIKNYTKTINEHGEKIREDTSELIDEIRSFKEQGDSLSKEIENTEKYIESYRLELFGNEDVLGIKNRIEKLVEEITNKSESISEYYNEILIGDEDTLSIKKSVLDVKAIIVEEQQKIEVILEAVEKETKELNNFHIHIFGEKTDDNEMVGGLSNDLERLMAEMVGFQKEQNLKYNTLNEQIEGLLPGATSAGLATAYKEMKDTFDKPIKNASRVFYTSVIGLVVISFFVAVESIGLKEITFSKTGDWSLVFMGLINKLPFYAPILWLAFYATRRRSENQRLQQEYAHKESLAKSYDSYKQQIIALDDEDKTMQKQFIMKAVDAIAYNASTTLDGKHGDKMPVHDMVEKMVETVLKVKDSK
jgi:hypothetical protein